MQYKAHLAGGIATGLLVSPIAEHYFTGEMGPLPVAIIFTAGAAIGSLLPDIDHRGSYLGRRLPLLSWITNKTLGHRGATHSPIVLTVFMLIFALISYQFAPAMLQSVLLLFIAGSYVGSLSHVFLDALTPHGVPIFYPFTKKTYRIARISSGGIGEMGVLLGCIALSFYLGVQLVL